MHDILANQVIAICTMLLLATLLLMLFHRFQFPYTIGLVIAGLVTGMLTDRLFFLEELKGLTLSHDLILYILLPPLVFEASLAINVQLLRNNLLAIMLLAVAGLLLSTFIVGGLVFCISPLQLMPALIFGALISATDPVAVIALFRELKVPERLSMLMDGESLFNDATAIVMFQVLIGMMTAAEFGAGDLTGAVASFLFIFFGGAAVGVLVGLFIAVIASLALEDKLVQITLSLVTAWSSFVLADHFFGVSGIMACVSAGMVTSYYARKRVGIRIIMAAERWWSYSAFLANTYVFLMLGLEEELLLRSSVIPHIPWLITAIVAALIGRFIVIYGLLPVYNKVQPLQERINRANMNIMFWGGLRGAVPMALALSLPVGFPGRALIFNMTLGVILWSLLVQGTTMKPLIRKVTEPAGEKT